MALELPFGIKPVNPVPVEYWSGPYTGVSISEAKNSANSGIPQSVRFISMEVSLIVNNNAHKYWYQSGIADNDLVSLVNNQTGYSTYNNITSDFSMSDFSEIVFLDTTGGSINVYLPSASGNGGKQLTVKLKAGSNSGVLLPSGSQTIDGQLQIPIYHTYQSVNLISDNSNWFIT